MTDYTYVSLVFLVIFIISTIILCREVKKYYAHEKELARTNDMYISHVGILSDKGIVCGVISTCSLGTLILLWIIPHLKQIDIL